MEKTFNASLDCLDELRTMVREFCATHRLNDNLCSELELAANEAATNIIEHADLKPKDRFTMSLEKDKKRLVITFRDPGKPYDFGRVATVKGASDIQKKRPRSGMGVYIIRQLVDAVIYNALPNRQNQLQLIKNL
jgi:anti-sigma regulatory factor (Ser/Thr protein kinase)